MTVSTSLVWHSYSPGAAMAAEAIPFSFLDSADVVVTHIEYATDLHTVLVPGTDYAITGDGPGGTASVTATAVWPALDLFQVARATETLQENHLPPHEPLPAAVMEQALDRQTLAIQEAQEQISRTLRVRRGETVPELPSAASRAGRLALWGGLAGAALGFSTFTETQLTSSFAAVAASLASMQHLYDLASTVALGDLSDVAMERMFARVLSGVSATSTADQTAALQSAVETASAYSIANQVMVELVLPRHRAGGLRACRVIPRPGVVINGNFGRGKTLSFAGYNDHKNFFRQDYNDNSWTDVPAFMRDWPVHFAVINFTVDGNAGSVSSFTWNIKRYDMTAGGSYTVFPTGLSFTGTAATAITATICCGLNDDWTIGAGGAGFTSDDVGRFLKLGLGTGGVQFNSTPPVLRIDSVGGGAVTGGTLIGRGAFTTKPTGTLAMTALVDADGIAVTGRAAFTLTPVTWRVVHVEPGTRPQNLLFGEPVETGGALAATFTGGTGAGATLNVLCEGDYYNNGVQGNGSSEHDAGFWWRNPQDMAYAPRWYFENFHVRNCQGDGKYFGSFVEALTRNGSSFNCFRGGYTIVCGGVHRIEGFKMRGWGLGLDIEYSGGWMQSATTLRVGPAYATLVAAGTAYKVGDVLDVVLPGVVTFEPAKIVILNADAGGAVLSFAVKSGGRYSAMPGSLIGLATGGGSGTGFTVTMAAGKDALDFAATGLDVDVSRGSNFLLFSGDYILTNSKFAGDVHNFQGGGGIANVQWIGNTLLSRVDGTNFATVLPGSFLSRGSRWTHRPRTRAVIPNVHNLGNDRASIVNIANNSAGAGTPNAIMNFIGDVFDGRSGYPLATYFGICCSPAFYQGVGYNRKIAILDCSFEADFLTRRIYNDRCGLLSVAGGDLGDARGGGIFSCGDHTAVNGVIGYGAAFHCPQLPRRGNANPFFDLPQPNGAAPQEARFFNRIEGTLSDADNLWGGVNDGTKAYAEMGGLRVMGEVDPTVTATPGFVGMSYRLRRATAIGQSTGALCTVGAAGTATWINLGTLSLGELSATAAIDIASIAASAYSAEQSIAVPGAHVGDVVRVVPATDLGSDGEIIQVRVSATNTVKFRVLNLNGSIALDLPSTVFAAYVTRKS